jgi:peptidoglycan-associated lipoprotein
MKRKYAPALGMILLLVLFLGACKKKEPPPPPPPPPPKAAPAPTVSLTATPTSIERGQSSTLEWSSTDAKTLTLEPALGMVPPKGTMTVSPLESLTYTLSVEGPGGKAQASVRVTVTAKPPPPAPKPPVEEDIAASFAAKVHDVYFDYDMYDVRSDAVTVLQANADWLRAHPKANIVVEGHCDERGSAEYNLGLGDRRANSTRDYLLSLGISGNRIRTISYGKERPQCTESNEGCWQRNRRSHFVLAR